MPLFERFHLSQEEAEARLKRALTGDPTRGEIGLFVALGANKLDDVQSRLARDATLGEDLRQLVADHLQKTRARWDTRKAWSVTLPVPITETERTTRGYKVRRHGPKMSPEERKAAEAAAIQIIADTMKRKR